MYTLVPVIQIHQIAGVYFSKKQHRENRKTGNQQFIMQLCSNKYFFLHR